MNRFVFKSYAYDSESTTAYFNYGFEDGRTFQETVIFQPGESNDRAALDRALILAFILIGVSYYKTFPSNKVLIEVPLDAWQADFFNRVYQEGLGQFAYENKLARHGLAHFVANSEQAALPKDYHGSGVLALQSGGKDSLLSTVLLREKQHAFIPWYVSSSVHYPHILDSFEAPPIIATRTIDRDALQQAAEKGAKNGHVPVTYIVQSLAVIQAIISGKNTVLTSIAHEGEEPHHYIDDLAVTHQWSKTWRAEQDFAEYVKRYISSDIKIGSPLRGYSELRVAELFVLHAWQQYGHSFSSCNVANYQQGSDNTTLSWCGNCPKCANSFILFAPFLESVELKTLFNDQDLFTKPVLIETFKGLLGIDDVPKPFECIGEIEELRLAYHMAMSRGGYSSLPFDVAMSDFDYKQTYEAQPWATEMIQ